MQTAAPSGTLTFVFTDIEGSTRRWEQHPKEMREQLAHHDRLVRRILERYGGYVFKTVGDAFYSAFTDPHEAVNAAAELEREIGQTDWGAGGELRIRIAIHTGAAECRDGDYFGPPLNRVARLLSLARGGQVLVSDATERLTRDRLSPEFSLVDLGHRPLKGLDGAVQVYQLSFPGMLPVFAPTSGHAFVPNNLPQELSTFVGRKSELQRVKKLLRKVRFVSIVGPGGVGKTRLALRAAADLCEEFPGGVWFVELSDFASEADVGVAVAKAMCVSIVNRKAIDAIAQHIGAGRALIVLDNSEQLIDGCRKFATHVMRRSPAVRILATTHQPFHVEGEHVFTLDPLPVPQEWFALEDLRSCDAARLFVERAHQADTAFKLTEKNRADIIAVCRTLEGIPLAIELAAARTRTLTLRQMLSRLNERFALLIGGHGEAGHHRTLRETIDWSYELLTEVERVFFARLGVLQGAFVLEAAESICSGSPIAPADIVDLLHQLVEKSFLTSAGDGEARRFRMLDTIRAYAAEKLVSAGRRDALAELHFSYFRQHILDLQAATGQKHTRDLDTIEQSHADVMAALDWAAEHHSPDLPLLALALVPFWTIRGYLREGAARIEAIANARHIHDALSVELLVHASSLRNAIGDSETAKANAEAAVRLCGHLADKQAVAEAHYALAGVFANSGMYSRAGELFATALKIFEELDDRRGCLRVLLNDGLIRTALGDFDGAQTVLERAAELSTIVDDTRLRAWTCGALGNLAQQSGKLEQAQLHYERCLNICRESADKSLIATTLNHLAEVALLRNNAENARILAEESLALVAEHGLQLQLADALEVAARFMVLREADVVAAQLFGAVDELRTRTSFPFTETEKKTREEFLQPLRQRHLDEWFESEHHLGAARTLESSIRLARASLAHR